MPTSDIDGYQDPSFSFEENIPAQSETANLEGNTNTELSTANITKEEFDKLVQELDNLKETVSSITQKSPVSPQVQDNQTDLIMEGLQFLVILILVGIVIWLCFQLNNVRDELTRLTKKLANLSAEKTVEAVPSYSQNLQENSYEPNIPSNAAATNFTSSPVDNKYYDNSSDNSNLDISYVQPQPSNSADFIKQCIDDFNNPRVERDEFIQKYSVQVFICINANARMGTNAYVKPEFAPNNNGNYWLIQNLNGEYILLPGISSYTPGYHNEQAMADFFESNYIQNNVYNKIFVEKVAKVSLIGNTLTPIEKGKLRLEN